MAMFLKKYNLSLLIVPLAAGLFMGRSVPGDADGRLAELYQRVKPAIVPLCRMDQREVVATGFLVSSEGHILTVNHYLETVPEPFLCALQDGKADGHQRAFSLDIVDRDAGHDLALLKLRNAADVQDWIRRKPGTAAGAVTPGREVSFYGYPHANELTIRTPTIHAGIVSAIKSAEGDREEKHFERLLQIDASAEKGFSGSPLFLNDTGQLAGVMTAHFGPDNQIAFAIPIEYADPMLKRHLKQESLADEG